MIKKKNHSSFHFRSSNKEVLTLLNWFNSIALLDIPHVLRCYRNNCAALRHTHIHTLTNGPLSYHSACDTTSKWVSLKLKVDQVGGFNTGWGLTWLHAISSQSTLFYRAVWGKDRTCLRQNSKLSFETPVLDDLNLSFTLKPLSISLEIPPARRWDFP